MLYFLNLNNYFKSLDCLIDYIWYIINLLDLYSLIIVDFIYL